MLGKRRPPPVYPLPRPKLSVKASKPRQKCPDFCPADMGRNEPGEPNGVTMIARVAGSNCLRRLAAKR